MIKVQRLRTTPYYVNYYNNGRLEPYSWVGSKNGRADIKEIPEYVVNWLLLNSVCFKNGELKIIEDNEVAKQVVENIADIEDYKNNTHSREEIEKLLNGNFLKMKSELSKITSKGEKQFVIQVAKEIKLDSSSKRKFIAEWIGLPADVLFDDDDIEEES